MEGLLVLGLLTEKLPGRNRALKTDSLEFIFLFCVTLGKLPKLSVLQFPRGFLLRICFNAESSVPGALLGLHTDALVELAAVGAVAFPILQRKELLSGVLLPVSGRA